MRVKCLAQEHNTMSPARAQTQTTQSRVERTNREAIMPLISVFVKKNYLKVTGKKTGVKKIVPNLQQMTALQLSARSKKLSFSSSVNPCERV